MTPRYIQLKPPCSSARIKYFLRLPPATTRFLVSMRFIYGSSGYAGMAGIPRTGSSSTWPSTQTRKFRPWLRPFPTPGYPSSITSLGNCNGLTKVSAPRRFLVRLMDNSWFSGTSGAASKSSNSNRRAKMGALVFARFNTPPALTPHPAKGQVSASSLVQTGSVWFNLAALGPEYGSRPLCRKRSRLAGWRCQSGHRKPPIPQPAKD